MGNELSDDELAEIEARAAASLPGPWESFVGREAARGSSKPRSLDGAAGAPRRHRSDVDPVAGSPADLGADTIAVFEDVAKDKNLSIGDPVPVVFKDTGPQELTVAMIYGGLSRPATGYSAPRRTRRTSRTNTTSRCS